MKREGRGLLHVSQSVRIVASVLLIVVWLGMFYGVLNVARQNVAARQERLGQLERTFLSVQEKTDEQLFTLMQISSSVHDNAELRKVALHEHSTVDLLHAQEELEKLLAFNPLINFLYYYIRDAEVLVTRSGVFDFSENTWYYLPFAEVDAARMQALLSGEMDGEGLYLLPAMNSANSIDRVIVAALPVLYHSTSAFATILIELR